MLILPSANRVYAAAAADLVRAELAAVSDAVLGGALSDAVPRELGGVPYLEFAADGLGRRATAFLANVSGCYALFERTDGLLRPLDLHRLDRYDDDLITIQKYPAQRDADGVGRAGRRELRQAPHRRLPTAKGMGAAQPGGNKSRLPAAQLGRSQAQNVRFPGPRGTSKHRSSPLLAAQKLALMPLPERPGRRNRRCRASGVSYHNGSLDLLTARPWM